MAALFVSVKIIQNQPSAHSSTMFTKGKCSLVNKCKYPHSGLRPRNKCISCKSQLHPSIFECSEGYGDDGEVKCKGGCASSSKAPPPQQKPQQQPKNKNQQTLSSSFVTKKTSKTAETTKQPVVKRKFMMRKCGQPKGSGADPQRTNTDWYAACEK